MFAESFPMIRYVTRYVFFMACFVFYANYSLAQQPYFQQEVNYSIDVSLNDRNHTLKGFEEIQYINKDNKALYYIYFHLWPNAYKNNTTALARQLAANGETDLVFAKEEDRGYIDSLNFTVNGKPVKTEATEHIDVIKLLLNEPLKSLDTLVIRTPFFVKLPGSQFSRLGHTGQSYFITQWYPKPAVYDREGWHPMPYLDQGEFFSEFGSFDVRITLPANYLLAATGDRVDAEAEEDWLNERVVETIDRLERNRWNPSREVPPSDARTKTVRFMQYKVHDFAWFADKTWQVLHDQVELPVTKKVVDTWIFFTEKNAEYWKDALNYVNESTLFYSYLLGEYAYNHVTAVDGTIMAGGGMEYPNITVIGDVNSSMELDITIAHEVGHNWFYGMLASNERDYPAMDEGLNSFYELRYMQAKYPEKKLTEYLNINLNDTVKNRFGISRLPYWKEKEIAYLIAARANTDQPINLNSAQFTKYNYGGIVYSKSAVAFQYLMYYMGSDNFDKAMQFYFSNYKFTHPGTSDLFKTLQYYSDSDLGWFRDYFILSNAKFDYKIAGHKRQSDGSHSLFIKNRTRSVVPFVVKGYKGVKLVGEVWSDGFAKKGRLEFPVSDIDYFKIDGDEMLPELYRHNNTIRTHGTFRKSEPVKINFLTTLESPDYVSVNWLPVAGYNYYDKWQLGLAVHNYGIYSKRFDYSLAPLFSFGTRKLTGMGSLAFNLYPTSRFEKISLSASVKQFAYDRFETKYLNALYSTGYDSPVLSYRKVSPAITFVLRPVHPRNGDQQVIRYASHQIFRQEVDIDKLATYADKGPSFKQYHFFVNELSYELRNRRTLDPYYFKVDLQHTGQMAKLGANLDYFINVSKRRQFKLSVFAGTFLFGKQEARGPYAFRLSGYNGYHDYLYDEIFLARSEFNGLGFSQFSERDGALKVWTPLGQTTEWLVAAHVISPKVFKLPFKVFADVASADARSMNREKVLYAAGINITLFKNVLDVYVPVIYSEDIRRTMELNNKTFWETIRFTLNLNEIDFKNAIKNNLF